MLGWSLYFKIAIKVGLFFKIRCSIFAAYHIFGYIKIFNNIWKKRCATSYSLETKSSFFTKIIFSLGFNFSERKGLTVCQNFLLSMISILLRLAKYFFFSFLKSDAHQFLCFVYKILPSVTKLKNLCRNTECNQNNSLLCQKQIRRRQRWISKWFIQMLMSYNISWITYLSLFILR